MDKQIKERIYRSIEKHGKTKGRAAIIAELIEDAAFELNREEGPDLKVAKVFLNYAHYVSTQCGVEVSAEA
jgi:hypothetical protein